MPPAVTEWFNNSFRATAHNAFERNRAASLLDALGQVSSIEIDFWDDEVAAGGVRALPGAWFVRHLPIGGNDSNGRPPGDLRACLLDVSDKIQAQPPEYGVIVFLDKQQGWGVSRTPSDLDALLTAIFGAKLFRPSHLSGSAGTPRASVVTAGWCTRGDLAGRIGFVLTGGQWGDLDRPGANGVLSQYVEERREECACFVAPHIEDLWEIANRPAGFRTRAAPWVVMFNNPMRALALSAAIHDAGFMSRVYVAGSDREYSECVARRANFIAVDDSRQRSWNCGNMEGCFLR